MNTSANEKMREALVKAREIIAGEGIYPVALARIDDALQSQAGTPPAEREGWKLVPVEPTGPMLEAGRELHPTDNPIPRTIYKAMLAAAPKAPQQVSNTPQDGESVEFAKGRLEGLAIAKEICDGLINAIDGGGNAYRRPADAEQCSNELRKEYATWFRVIYPVTEVKNND